MRIPLTFLPLAAAFRGRALRRLGTSLPTFILGLSVILLFLACLSPAPAQQNETTVRAILDPRRIVVGGQATFTIETTGTAAASLPRQIGAPGLSINYGGHNTSVQIANGQRTERYSYVYSVRADSAGRFRIPPIQVNVGGQTFTTQTQELVVEEPSTANAARAQAPYFLELEVPDRAIYVGEVVPLKLTLYVLGRNTISGVGQPEMERENLVMKRFPTSPRSGATEIDGRIYSSITLETSLFAIAEGKVAIGPCSLPAMFYESQEYARVPSIFRRANRRTFTSNSVELDVKPLPEKGRPDDFSGAVGVFDLNRTASPTRLQTGDPISVDLEITGIGNFDSINSPAMTSQDGWQLYPSRELVQDLSDGVTSGKVTYSQVVIPLEEKREVPPFRFSYFDPRQQRYIVARTEPIPIEVLPDGGVATLDPGSETPGMAVAVARPSAGRPVAGLEDILTIAYHPPALRAQATPILRSPLFWAANSIPALALLGFAGTGIRQRWFAWRSARIAEPAPRTFDEIFAGLRNPSLSRRNFYREALDCIEASPVDPDPSTSPGRELASLKAATLGLLYGDDNERVPDGPMNAGESRAVIQLLAQLKSR